MQPTVKSILCVALQAKEEQAQHTQSTCNWVRSDNLSNEVRHVTGKYHQIGLRKQQRQVADLIFTHYMAGLYIHVPFCRKACHYCNFHFSTRLAEKGAMIDAICKELYIRKDFFGSPTPLSTIYLGGGTPSLLDIDALQKLFSAIQKYYKVSPDAEVTMEANPDDLDCDYLNSLRTHTPVNRLSIGIQSFQEETLQWMNRAHHAKQSIQAIHLAREAGFENISIDLIYGLPAPFDAAWEKDLLTVLEMDIPHLSCYALTIEPSTALAYHIKKKSAAAPSDLVSAQQFLALSNTVRNAGYRHYEISNIAKPGFEAKHNSSYWEGVPYLGVGPSAHSFRPYTRSWNISNNALYIKAIQAGGVPYETEVLSPEDRYNEFIMTGLRLEAGIRTDLLDQMFGKSFSEYFFKQIERLNNTHYNWTGNTFYLTDNGRLWCDNISGTLFYTS